MAISKRILIPGRRRSVPPRDWSWIDRRFLREHADGLGRDALLVYFFLAAVADKDGLSFYGDASLGARLRMDSAAIVRARDELVRSDLVAYEPPLHQVLSLPVRSFRSRAAQPACLADILATAFECAETGRATR